jgi:peptidoglycan/LPS O-acetylase OafA/YrhL
MSKPAHFDNLDGMRGVLACSVMMLHLGINNVIQRATHSILLGGLWELSVDFFFMLSGFVLCRSFIRSDPTFADYAVRRLRRLVPMFLLTTLVMAALTIEVRPLVLLLNLFGIQSLVGGVSINFPAWSVPIELFFPAAGLVLVWGPKALSLRLTLAGLFILALLGCFTALSLAHGLDYRLLRGVAGLGCGFLLYRLWEKHPGTPGNAAYTAMFILTLLVLLAAKTFPMVAVLFYPLGAATIFLAAGNAGLLSRAPFRALGRWSYSIYLTHIPILFATQMLFGPEVVGKNPPLKMALAVLTIAISAACYRWVELPIMTGKRGPETAP